MLAAIYNPHRDTQEYPEPFPASYFHPLPDRLLRAEALQRERAREEARRHRLRLRDLQHAKSAILGGLKSMGC